MTSRDRVKAVIDGKDFDRIPIYGWLRANMDKQISDAFGCVEAFEDKYEFDFTHVFGGPTTYLEETINEVKNQKSEILPTDVIQLDMCDPSESIQWDSVRKDIEFYGKDRERFTYIQTPGIFEKVNGYFGIENHLMYMALYTDELKELYKKEAKWNKEFAMNALDLGIDMVHISDDWGGQNSLMFNPKLWKEAIAPNHKLIVDAIHERGAYASLHSDGNVNSILDGIAELGYDVVHPYQVSAGMDYDIYLDKYTKSFAIMGGIDIQTTLGFDRLDDVKNEIDNVLNKFKNRGLMLCTTHYVQDHCSIEELVYAYDYIYKNVRKV